MQQIFHANCYKMCIRDRPHTLRLTDFLRLLKLVERVGLHLFLPDGRVQRTVQRTVITVSYTHLDVYKRQDLARVGILIHTRSDLLAMQSFPLFEKDEHDTDRYDGSQHLSLIHI